VPFIRPYRIRADIASWMGDPKIFDLVQEEYARGEYRGIGEFHLAGQAAASAWVKRTVDFAVEKNLYLHCHCDAVALELLYQHNPKARVIWAHTGFSLEPGRVAELLERYRELWGELSYRGGITDSAGKLTAAWRNMLTRHPDRFLIGSDTWINERWASYGTIMADYRAWLAQLPPETARLIASGNARRLFAE
jgi:predicted TIM-barrel fold metal-dependent hydrolase